MAKILTEVDYRDRFNRIMEYTQAIAPTRITEADPTMEDPTMGGAPEGGVPPMGNAPADPMADGMDMGDAAASSPMGNAPAPQTGAEVPAEGGEGQGVEGLNPQGGEEVPADDPAEDEDIENMEEGDEVIDIDSLTGYQKETAKGVGRVSDEIKDLKDLIIRFQEKVEANNQGIESLQRELERRAPNAEEKMSLRQQKSAPFNQSIENYWQNDAPENYSIEDDNNGADSPKYQITKADIDGVTDWNNIAKSFDDMAELNSLKNIFGF